MSAKRSPHRLMGLPAEKTSEYLLLAFKHGGGSVIVLAALSWESLTLTITPHSAVMAKVYEAFYLFIYFRTSKQHPLFAVVLWINQLFGFSFELLTVPDVLIRKKSHRLSFYRPLIIQKCLPSVLFFCPAAVLAGPDCFRKSFFLLHLRVNFRLPHKLKNSTKCAQTASPVKRNFRQKEIDVIEASMKKPSKKEMGLRSLMVLKKESKIPH